MFHVSFYTGHREEMASATVGEMPHRADAYVLAFPTWAGRMSHGGAFGFERQWRRANLATSDYRAGAVLVVMKGGGYTWPAGRNRPQRFSTNRR